MNKSGSHRGWSRFIPLAACVAMVGVLTACARPASMQVREGDSPRHEDKDVAFRTTYYFRVFDYCAGADSSKAAYARVPRIDSLYRFRMTGKASTIGKTIKFESGTLKSYQIDPFGAGVVYDKRTGRFRFVSQQEASQRAKREAALADFERLLDRYRELAKENDANRREALKTAVEAAVLAAGTQVERNEDSEEYAKGLTALITKATFEDAKVSEGVPTATLELLQSALNDQLRTFAEINPNALRTLAEEEREEAASLERRLDDAPVNQAAAEAGLVCPGSLTRRRGFQILGPEGWRTFNQDDRLLMAMSSDASPIIGVLEDLSSRVLNARSRNEALLLPLAQERLRTVEAQRKLEQMPPDASSAEAIRAVLEAFNQSAEEEERSE